MKGTLEVLDKSGHTAVEWDTDLSRQKGDTLTQEDADREFARLVGGGHLAFVKDPKSGENVQLRQGEFDPTVHEKVVMSPAFVGG